MMHVGRGLSKGVIKDNLWYNNRLDKVVKINDCSIGYELEITVEDPMRLEVLSKLKKIFNDYTNVIIKETDIEETTKDET
jgi:hypothetical protein